MSPMVRLQIAIKNQEHFEILEELAAKLKDTGEAIEHFAGTTDINGHRAKFTELMGYSQVLLDLCRMKLSLMDDERKEVEAKAVSKLLEEYEAIEEEVSFSLEDF